MIEEIEQMWSVDCVINNVDLEQASMDTYTLHSKYYKYYNAACKHLAKLEIERSKITLLRTDYFLGVLDQLTLKNNGWKANPRTILKADIPNHLSADSMMIEINLKIADIKIVINFLESIIKIISNRGFHVKNILENRRFLNGGN